jgi:hypothetical protein
MEDGAGTPCRVSYAVLMDLRGFSPGNQGCVFEINELLNTVPLDRIVFVVDGTTDDAFLREMFAQGWAMLRADSPNRALTGPRVHLFPVHRYRGRQRSQSRPRGGRCGGEVRV